MAESQAQAGPQSEDIASDILQGAADAAARLAPSLSGEAKAATLIAAGLTRLVAELIRTLGVHKSKAVLEELKRRVDVRDGVISNADLEEDDVLSAQLVQELFRTPGGEA